MGGGGGAGESNNNAGTSGAPGGGIVLVLGNSIDGAGTGTIIADGATAQTTLTGPGLSGNDAPGGGGGGGTVVLAAPTVTSLAISAQGGGGGLQNITIPPEAEGPGGGGGGGFIAVPAGYPVTTPPGGAGGTSNSSGVTKFPTNGATYGATGQTAAIAVGSQAPMCIATDLALTMSDAAGSDTPGDSVTYTIVVTNNGPNPATGATVTDAFSGQFSSESWTCTGAACPAASGSGSLSAVLLTLAPGAQVTFTVTATVATDATGTLSNTATVAAPAGVVDPNPANNTATDSNGLTASADLAATLTNAPANVVVGTTYTYTIGVANNGPSDATTVAAQLSIPNGATFQSAVGAGWTCSFTAPDVNCTATTLSAGASAPITVTLTAPPAPPGSGSASVTVSAATGDPDLTNNSATDSITFQCGVDTDCPGGDWCSLGACTPQLANGTPMPVVSPINGQCTPGNGQRVCLSGVCDPNGNVCGINLGDGTCAATSQCNAGVCVTTGPNTGTCQQCGADTDCSAPTAVCDTTISTCVQCTTAEPAACTGVTPVCSALDTCVACDGDNGAGSANGCPIANPYCLSTGACTTCTSDAMCTTGTHVGPYCDVTTGACTTVCQTDAECGAGNWCNNISAVGVCQPLVANGQPVPGGTCTTTIGARACLSAVCDTTSDDCVQCTVGAAAACTGATPVCVTTGPNTDTCQQCGSNSDCGASTPVCDPTTNTCVQCTSGNTAACSGTTPVCSPTETCVACNGDNGTGATLPCPGADPYCASTGACILCTSDAMCTTGSHPGPYCDTSTGACTTTCQNDADCSAGHWCNNLSGPGVCQPKVANGQPVPGGTCTTIIGGRACLSTVCDTNDNECGYANGDGPCTGSNGATECRSTICAMTGPNAGLCVACTTSAQCSGATPACNTTTNTCVQCTTSATCPTQHPVCDSTSSTCVVCNGDLGSTATDPCSSASAPFCFLSGSSAGQCGKCTTNADCTGHSGPICDTTSGLCTTQCTEDSECLSSQWCNAPTGGQGVCVAKLANGTSLPSTPSNVATCSVTVGQRVCISGVCDTTTNQCGDALGHGPCTSSAQCITGICDPLTQLCTLPDAGVDGGVKSDASVKGDASTGKDAGTKKDGGLQKDATTSVDGAVVCHKDTDCSTDDYCGSSGVCTPKLPTGATCERESECQSGDCASGVCSTVVSSGNGLFCAVRESGSQGGGRDGGVFGLMLALAGVGRRRARRDRVSR